LHSAVPFSILRLEGITDYITITVDAPWCARKVFSRADVIFTTKGARSTKKEIK
jgi:hypothetical protein